MSASDMSSRKAIEGQRANAPVGLQPASPTANAPPIDQNCPVQSGPPAGDAIRLKESDRLLDSASLNERATVTTQLLGDMLKRPRQPSHWGLNE